ncbi:hypothetical protein U1Q18_005476 [Sarracenia purpurea var. burkii]
MEEQQEDSIIKHPSLPLNYVTLVQLQERWVKEQQRKKREKEEEEERKRREKEEEEGRRKREDQVNRKRQSEKNRVRIVMNTVSRRPPVRRDCMNQSAKRCETVGMIGRKSDRSRSVEIVVDDGERKIVDFKKNREKKTNQKRGDKNMTGKPRAVEDLTGGTEQLLPECEAAAEKNPVISTERESEKKEVSREFRRNGQKSVEKKLPVDGSTQMRRNFEDLSLNGGKGGYSRYGKNMHRGQMNYYTDSGRVNNRRMQRPRDSNLVWVKKGDSSDTNASGVWTVVSKNGVGIPGARLQSQNV